MTCNSCNDRYSPFAADRTTCMNINYSSEQESADLNPVYLQINIISRATELMGWDYSAGVFFSLS